MFEKHSFAIVAVGVILFLGLIAGLLWFTLSNQSGELGKDLNLQADIAFILDKYAQAPQEIKNSYQVEGAALVQPPPDENGVKVEIKSGVASNSAPSVQFSRWDGEVKLEIKPVLSSAELKDKTLSFKNEKIKIATAKTDYRFYELPKDKVNAEGAYEIDAVLKEKPASNVISFDIKTENLDFFYQPPLNQENPPQPSLKGGSSPPLGGVRGDLSCTETDCFDKDGKTVTHRPENVVGSYAVYYKDGVSGDYTALGGKNYMAGKAFHIYRPQIIDAQGNKVWGELSVDTQNNKLAIAVPQDFLDKAAYPVIVDPTFGYTTQGSGWGGDWTTNQAVGSFLNTTASVNGDVDSISIAVYAGSGNMKGFIVNASTLAILTNGVSPSASIATGWNTINYSTKPSVVNGTTYSPWAVFSVPSGGISHYRDSGTSGDSKYETDNNYTTPTNPSSVSNSTNKYSIYATYTAAATARDTTGASVSIGSNTIFNRNVVFRAPGVAATAAWACGNTVVSGIDGLTYGTVTGEDGKCWLDRNLGAIQLPTAYGNGTGYGSLYQWGRLYDGHQATTSSSYIGTDVVTTATAVSAPYTAYFIATSTSPYDWLNQQNNNLWQGVNGTNNTCPSGFRLPTQAEWNAWTIAAGIKTCNGTPTDCRQAAYNTSLKLPAAGARYRADGSLGNQGSDGLYWSSSPYSTYAYDLGFDASSVNPAYYTYRAYGFSVRCVKD